MLVRESLNTIDKEPLSASQAITFQPHWPGRANRVVYYPHVALSFHIFDDPIASVNVRRSSQRMMSDAWSTAYQSIVDVARQI